jgi:hypothetical protein
VEAQLPGLAAKLYRQYRNFVFFLDKQGRRSHGSEAQKRYMSGYLVVQTRRVHGSETQREYTVVV